MTPSLDHFLDHHQLSASLSKGSVGRSAVPVFLEDPLEEDWEEGGSQPLVIFSQEGRAVPSQKLSLLLEAFHRMKEELQVQPARLLSLNPSRREAILHYLVALTGGGSKREKEEVLELKQWLERPSSASSIKALEAYFEETAAFALCEALLLKVWSDQGGRPLREADLGQLNWALSGALRPFLVPEREGWQFSKPNLYSWYNPGAELQRWLWDLFQRLSLDKEDVFFLHQLLQKVLNLTERFETGYDPRFAQSLWENFSFFQSPLFSTDPAYRKERWIFCPTLREGSLLRAGLPHVQWMGAESTPFLFFLLEWSILWQAPCAPPHWLLGTGLEAYPQSQSSLPGMKTRSPSQRLMDREDCEAAFVMEEHLTRLQSKSSLGALYRKTVEALPDFKKYRGPQTSLGTLQACVALSKLRPGGLFWWARSEPLSQQEGAEALQYLLNRAQLLYEWDFQNLEHAFPAHRPLFPRSLYLFRREPDLHLRSDHVPHRVLVQGTLRSHVEVSLVLQDVLLAALPDHPLESRGSWKIHRIPSPHPQKYWFERWPDPTSFEQVERLEALVQKSVPLAALATLQSAPMTKRSAAPVSEWGMPSLPSVPGFGLQASQGGPACLEMFSLTSRAVGVSSQNAFLVLLPQSSWVAPLQAYLRHPLVQLWVDHHVEKKGEQWILQEQLLKCLPIPHCLVQVLEGQGKGEGAELWELIHRFVGVAQAQAAIEERPNGKLFHADGSLDWGALLRTRVSAAEQVPWLHHAQLKVVGQVPPHLPILHRERFKRQSLPGILLQVESGAFVQVQSESAFLIQILWDQLAHLRHAPTWSELQQTLTLPRHLSVVEGLALELLREQACTNEERQQLEKELQELCQSWLERLLSFRIIS